MIDAFISGAISMGYLITAGYFIRFWQQTRDRLFLFFSTAFVILVIERVLRSIFLLGNEFAPFVYSTRLIAFAIIILAIIDKNRRRDP